MAWFAGDSVVRANDGDESVGCAESGFNSNELLCSTCEDLGQFKLGHLSRECHRCCKADPSNAGVGVAGDAVKYPKAVLEVCG